MSPERMEANQADGGENKNGALAPTPPPQGTKPSSGINQVGMPLPMPDLDSARTSESDSGPTQPSVRTLGGVMSSPSPSLSLSPPDVPSGPIMPAGPEPDNDSIEGRVLGVVSGVQPSFAVREGDGTGADS